MYGIGTKLITSYNNASLGGVYKLCALEEDGKLVPKIKISNSHEKTTNPGVKKIVRIFKDGMAQADLICLEDETFDTSKPLTIFHPEQTWKKTTFTDYTVKELMVPVFKDGKLVYDMPSLKQICDNEDENIKEFSRNIAESSTLKNTRWTCPKSCGISKQSCSTRLTPTADGIQKSSIFFRKNTQSHPQKRVRFLCRNSLLPAYFL